jgi:hypothetical protein
MANLTAVIGADTSKFVNEVKEARNILDKFVSATNTASQTVNRNTSATNEQVNAYKRVVKQLEKVASGNMSTTQQTKALESQVRELKIQWANLSDEAKKSDFGKAISGSLNSASTQLNTLKQQLEQAGGAAKSSSEKAVGFDGSLVGLVGVAKKLAPAIGTATAALGSFKEIVASSQTTSDSFNNALSTGKNVVKELASAIATFDFSSFAAGLDSIIKKGWDAANAIDQLGNTIMSYSVKSAKANQKLSSARAILSDPNSTKEQVAQAKKDMKDALDELKGAASVMMSDYEDALIAEVNARGGSLSGEGALAILDKWLEVDTSANREQIKAEAKAGYDAYIEELKALQGRHTTSITMPTSWGATSMSTVNRTPEYEKELSDLNSKYKDQIAYHVLLEKYSDEELKKLGEQRIAMININGQLDSYANSMNKINNRTTSGSGGSNSSSVNAQIGSIAEIKRAISESEKLKEAAVVGTDEWWNQVRALEALNEQLAEAQSREKRLTSTPLEAIPTLNPIVGKVKGPEMKLAGKSPFETQMEQLDEWKEHYKKTMEEVEGYSNILDSVSNLFSALGSNMDDNTQSWMQFGVSVVQTVAKIIPQLLALTTANATEAGSAGAAAAAEAGKSVANIPYVGPFMAVAAIASVMAEIITMFSSMPHFANGGIIGGSSSIGDYNIARVNSGEMILNGSQQKRLFNLLDGSESMTSSKGGGQVEFKIRGTELIGCINNTQKKRNKV